MKFKLTNKMISARQLYSRTAQWQTMSDKSRKTYFFNKRTEVVAAPSSRKNKKIHNNEIA